MPRENRKRGKKHKKQKEEDQVYAAEPVTRIEEEHESQAAGPSWIVKANATEAEVNPEAPFGYVNPDLKAYFKTVDEKLREWQEQGLTEAHETEGVDPNEERRLFLVAALTELSGNEKQLSTDPDCSNVLERMSYSMDDFIKRVFFDRLAGSYVQLSKHRFGSHVVQTLLGVARGTVHREMKGVLPPLPESDSEAGDLPLLKELVLSACKELLPSITALVMDPFASHVVRALFVLLSPALTSTDSDSTPNSRPSVLRSKKSAKHRAKQGPMKSVFANEEDESTGSTGKATPRLVPPEFTEMAEQFVSTFREKLSANEVRALAADKVACPVLVVLLEMEDNQGRSNTAGSLMDSISFGLVSARLDLASELPEPSDYVTTLLREPTSSHLLEKLVSLSPQPVLDALWELYFQGRLNKLAVHPVANFVVARAIERLAEAQLRQVLSEAKHSWSKIIKSSRTGIFRALVDRAVSLPPIQQEVCEAILGAFNLDESERGNYIIPCIMHLKAYEEEAETARAATEATGEDSDVKQAKRHVNAGHSEPTTQGSILLQSLLRLPEPHNQSVIDSLTSLPTIDFISLCHNPTSSRVVDAFLESSTVPSRAKRKLLLSLIGHYHELVDDRIGSRVGDRCWNTADPYLKEKIARSLIAQEQFLAGSFYGKFFARNLHLHLLKRKPEEWKELQTSGQKSDGTALTVSATTVDSSTPLPKDAQNGKAKKRKRDDKPEDEIDALFSSALGKKTKKGNLESTATDMARSTAVESAMAKKRGVVTADIGLETVLGAIRSAPKELKERRKKG